MQKYNTSYTQLSNIIIQMSDYHRSELLEIAKKILKGQNYRTYNMGRKSNRLRGVFIGFMAGFIFATAFYVYFDQILDLVRTLVSI